MVIRIKITLIFPKSIEIPSKYLPLGIAYIASSLENNGYSVDVIDANVLSFDNERVVKEVLNKNPNIVGISVNIGNFSNAKEICCLLKKHDFSGKIIIGGPISIIYDELLEFSDFVITGEGEKSIIDLVSAITKKTNFRYVSGVAFKKNDKIIITPKRYIQNIDNIPFPAWHLFPSLKKYKTYCRKKPDVSIITSRGCPFQCIYCDKNIFGYKFRMRSPENIIKEIEFLDENYNIKELTIMDDNFTLYRERAEKICDMMVEKDFDIQWKCWNGVRAETLNKKLLEKMRDAGCYLISIGAETGNQEIANKIQRNQNLNAVRKVAKLIKKMGFLLYVQLQIGLPYDTQKTMNQTIKFAKELNPDLVQFSLTTPLQGTKLFELVKDKGNFLYDVYNFKGFYGGKAAYEIFDLKAKNVENMYNKAYIEFYNINKIFSIIKKIKTWEEFKYYFNAGFHLFKSIL